MNKKLKRRLIILVVSTIILLLVKPIAMITKQETSHRWNLQKEKEQFAENVVEEVVNPSEAPTASPEPTAEPKPIKVRLVMIGDMLLHGYVQQNGRYPDGTYNYDHFFKYIKKDVKKADVAVVNQEVIIGGPEFGIRTYPRFNCLFEVGDALEKAGFDVVLHATNHTIDQGVKGVENCMKFWDESYPDMTYLGIHKSKKDYNRNIYVYEKKGFKIAMLNYTESLNGLYLPSSQSYLVNTLEKEKVVSDIRKARKKADFVVIYPHWGTEYVLGTTSQQEKWAKIFADSGADLVIGTHPHVVEPVKWVEGKNGHQTLVFYSIGNFVSAQDKTSTMLGAMADVRLEKTADGQVEIKKYKAVPLVTHREQGYASITTCKLEKYTEEMAARNRIRYVDRSFSLQKLWEIWNQVMK